MVNNFFVGIVCHKKRLFRQESRDKMVLYGIDGDFYIDLINSICYSTDSTDKDYVEKESLIPTDVSLYNVDYMYLLSKFKEKGITRMKKIGRK